MSVGQKFGIIQKNKILSKKIKFQPKKFINKMNENGVHIF